MGFPIDVLYLDRHMSVIYAPGGTAAVASYAGAPACRIGTGTPEPYIGRNKNANWGYN